MPKEYLSCVESEKAGGKSEDEAQKICAIAFYNRHGMSIDEWHKKHESHSEFTPPDSGDAPKEMKKILSSVYSSIRQKWVDEHPDDRENEANKTSAAKQAWAAVHNAGWMKDHEGKWHNKKEATNMAELSFNDIRTMIEQALNPAGDFKNWVQDIYPEKCIVNMAGELYEVPYTIKDGKAETGEKKRVKVAYEPFAEIPELEIFEAGTYRGKTYTEADLDTIVKNFDELKDEIKPVAVIGHSEEQDIMKQSGIPAAGWMTSLKRVGKKLVAAFKDVPKVIASLVEKKAYARVSSEIYNDYNGKGFALRRVALLGGEIPEVKTLQDVMALYADSPKGETTWVSLNEKTLETAKDGPEPAQAGKETFDMDVQELAEKVVELTAKVTNVEASAAEKDAEITRLKEENKNNVTRLSEAERTRKTGDIKRFCADRVKDGRLSPAMWGLGLEQFMESLDDNSIVRFGEGKRSRDLTQLGFVKTLFMAIPKNSIVKFGEVGSLPKDSNDLDAGTSAADRLQEATKKIMAADKTLLFNEAFSQAQKENPDLAKEYAAEISGQ